MSFPRIDLLVAPPDATELVVLAHGGAENSLEVPGAFRPPILRMWPFARAAAAGAPGAAVGLIRYRYRGWNGADAHPAADLRAVLDKLPPRITRVLLIGHSMGGRAIVAASNHPLVAGVLGLAPWLPSGEPLVAPRGPVVLAHGTDDRVTNPALTADYARRLRASGAPVALLSVDGETHSMLRRSADWNALVAGFTAGTSYEPMGELPRSSRSDSALRGVVDVAKSRLHLRVVGSL
ncbi:dienelactone hydrolase family protein [Kribbella catacumbae]|uniref:dienelactone hydrolase family protein n=1 Tax=Kribbella catacumbae TaxID=460086 RepID=UPI00037910C7|nr:alpha/beta fold hydrolase [Kribbella catacumbae]